MVLSRKFFGTWRGTPDASLSLLTSGSLARSLQPFCSHKLLHPTTDTPHNEPKVEEHWGHNSPISSFSWWHGEVDTYVCISRFGLTPPLLRECHKAHFCNTPSQLRTCARIAAVLSRDCGTNQWNCMKEEGDEDKETMINHFYYGSKYKKNKM